LWRYIEIILGSISYYPDENAFKVNIRLEKTLNHVQYKNSKAYENSYKYNKNIMFNDILFVL